MASTTSKNPNPTTPPYNDSLTYAEAYLAIHTMSPPSYRYAYLLWFSIIFVFLIFALLHWTGGRGGALGALWSKWTLRRRTWRKKRALEAARRNPAAHRQPFAFPSNAQLLSSFALTTFTLAACFVGPDYISPSATLWEFHAQRDGFDQLQPNSPPPYTINKAWWTVGGRTGIIAFSLFPLVVLFALKTPPFAFLSFPFLLQLHFDKLSRIHRWSGVLVWIVSTLHAAAWGVQLGRDRRVGVDNQSLWLFVWGYNKFVYGCIAYFCLTLLVLLSLPVIRSSYYEAFYALHVLLVPLSIAMSGFHFPRIGWWCWIALGIWIGERLWRTTHFVWTNARSLHVPRSSRVPIDGVGLAWELNDDVRVRQWSPSHTTTYSEQFDISMYAEPANSSPHEPSLPPSTPTATTVTGTIPPGFGWAYLLPGRTIRLRINTYRQIRWSPGQHILLRIPSISRFTTHPFTIASVCRIPGRGSPEPIQPVDLLIRAKGGFTRDLWNEVSRLTTLSRVQAPFQPEVGALLKAQVDGPFGSVSRTRWGNFSSVLIISGGSGVSFGIAILEFLCLCMSGKKPSTLGSNPGGLGYFNFRTRRVRFIWLVREYSHLQWCAAALWRCSKLLPAHALELDIYVTNISRSVRQRHAHTNVRGPELGPPTPSFTRVHYKRSSWASVSVESDDEQVSVTTPTSTIYLGTEEPGLHPLDLTNFDGDDDSFMPGEAQLSYRVHKEGHLRRRETQRRSGLPLGSASRRGVQPMDEVPIYATPSQDSLLTPHTPWPQEDFNPYRMQPPVTRQTYSQESTPHPKTPGSTMQIGRGTQLQASHFAIETEDSQALLAISEIARSGKPQLDSILAEEVERSRGAVGVACCGPTSLNALMRKLVAAKIDPARVRAGDLRGSITLISEDFDY